MWSFSLLTGARSSYAGCAISSGEQTFTSPINSLFNIVVRRYVSSLFIQSG
jgi:hypothetical protein